MLRQGFDAAPIAVFVNPQRPYPQTGVGNYAVVGETSRL